MSSVPINASGLPIDEQVEILVTQMENNGFGHLITPTREAYIQDIKDWAMVVEYLCHKLDIPLDDKGCPATRGGATKVANYILNYGDGTPSEMSHEHKEAFRPLFVEHAFGFKKPDTQAPKKKRKNAEEEREQELCAWLETKGVLVERQVSTSAKHRLDLWVPGKFILELKAGTVNSDDFCQALDYYGVYEKPIILVGNSLTAAASRGLQSVASLLNADAIIFMTWGAIRKYLEGTLRLS